MIEAIFFDIDGTLIPHGETTIPPLTLQALWQLKEKGIRLFVATGRPPNSIAHVQAAFPFDGYLTANGQYCFTAQNVIHEQYIPSSSLRQLLPYLDEQKLPVLCAGLEKSFRNIYNQGDFDSPWPIIDLNEIVDFPIVQIMAYIDPKQDEAFLKHLPGCKSARWTHTFADIIPADGGKDKGIDHLIQYFQIPLTHVMAIGDGGNDITMLDHVMHSVAMGNASMEVKQHAHFVTDDIKQNGILKALQHYRLL